MIHLDLFSGIGGFAYAADQLWNDVEHVFVENDPFCQQVLKKHWPNSQIHGDIKTFTNTESKQTLAPKPQRLHTELGIQNTGIFILTGGFPCQPFSQAGRRKGTADDRYLWPEMFRVIREFRPQWVIAENVAGLVTWNEGMVLEQVCSDLEKEGYEVQPFIIPAVAVNAPHRRDRVWIVANSRSHQSRGLSGGEREEVSSLGNRDSDTSNTRRKYRKSRSSESSSSETTFRRTTAKETKRFERLKWNENWIEVATRLCRVDDGLPRRMDRNPRLKALGNAIVPQVAEEIMRAIRLIDN